MKVLFLSTRSPYPLISGHSLRTYHTLKGAAERHQVTLITFIQKQHELDDNNLNQLKKFCHAVYPIQIPSDQSRFNLIKGLLLD
jgi:hypothetical protein